MTRIILIGYMGSGKTTLGKALSKELGLPFFDLDWYIENRFCRTVSQLFAERGEEGFRHLEREMLHEVAEFENVVIAAGGGTPCFFDNIDYMNRQAQTVYLKATPDVLFRHLQPGRSKRPLLAGKPTKKCGPTSWNRWHTEHRSTKKPTTYSTPIYWKTINRYKTR